MFSIIAAVGKNNELGKNNGLIFHIKEDMKFFRETTTDHQVVMGYNTWKSLPGKLKNRHNIVISEEKFTGPDEVVTDLDAFIAKNQTSREEIFIIGGGMIYREFLPYAKNLYLTEVDATDSSATVFFPNFNRSDYRKEVIKEGSENNFNYAFVKYVKKEKK